MAHRERLTHVARHRPFETPAVRSRGAASMSSPPGLRTPNASPAHSTCRCIGLTSARQSSASDQTRTHRRRQLPVTRLRHARSSRVGARYARLSAGLPLNGRSGKVDWPSRGPLSEGKLTREGVGRRPSPAPMPGPVTWGRLIGDQQPDNGHGQRVAVNDDSVVLGDLRREALCCAPETPSTW
jgi:hypothetical protein